MKTSRNLVFLGVVALLLLLGAAVSVRSRAATSPVAVDAPAAVALASSSRYQGLSQPYNVGTGAQGLSNLESRRAKSQSSTGLSNLELRRAK